MKHIALIALLAFGGISLPVYAHSESDWMKKTVRVSWHAVKTASGYVLLQQFYRKSGRTCWPCPIAGEMWRYPGDTVPYALGGFLLFKSGLKGLDEELHIWKKINN